MIERCDVAVVGAGIVGLAAADAVARRGADVVAFEAATPGSGQSAGWTRIFRHVHQRPDLVRLAAEALADWRRLEQRCGRRLVGSEGLVYAGPAAGERAAALESAGVPHRWLDGAELVERHAALRPEIGPALLDEAAGAVRTRRAIAALTDLLGPRLVRAEVLGLRRRTDAVEVETPEGVWHAGHVLVCAGMRSDELAAAVGIDVRQSVFRHVRVTFRAGPTAGPRRACLIDATGRFGETVYACPVGSSDRYVVGLNADDADPPLARGGERAAGPAVDEAVRRTAAYVRRALPGLDPEPVGLRLCATTLVSAEADAMWLAGDEQAHVFAGTNAFKFGPRLGELLADAALGGEVHPALAPARPSFAPA